MTRFLVSFDGHELDAAARERLMAAGAEFVAELELAADDMKPMEKPAAQGSAGSKSIRPPKRS
jgi:hypothetical protein